MAARNDSRVARAVVRDSGNDPRIPRSTRVPHKPTPNPSAPKPGFHGCAPQDPLTDITRYLKVIGAIAVTVEVALRAQNCERDADIANCLRHGVVDALSTQIERMSQLRSPVARDTP
jgi:hypothetical protein